MVVVHRPRGVCRSSYGLNNQRLAALAIGGTRPGNAVFVPAPSEELPALLTNFEKYLQAENGLPPLVRIGLAHVQFETIHPYLDGNGRIGRLLITLLLDWESWMNFFLEGVATIADEAVAAVREVFALISEDRQRLLAAPGASVMSIRLIEQLPMHPVVTIPAVVKLLQDDQAHGRQGGSGIGKPWRTC